MNLRTAFSVVAALLAGASVPAQTVCSGRIVDRGGAGYWACFGRPVAVGAEALISPLAGTRATAIGKVGWVCPVPPYDAFVTDVRGMPGEALGSRTEYERLLGERGLPPVGQLPHVAIGYSVRAVLGRASADASGDRIQVLLGLLRERPDVREATRPREAPGRGAGELSRLLPQLTGRTWAEPITSRLAALLADAVRSRHLVQGAAPEGWFPVAASRQPDQTTP